MSRATITPRSHYVILMGSAGSAPAPVDFQSTASTKLAYHPLQGSYLSQPYIHYYII